MHVDDLLLDLENPRIGNAPDQRATMEAMLASQGDKIYRLAKDIVNQRMLNPLDRVLVSPANGDGRHVVWEGNRRILALKLLYDFALVDSLSMTPFQARGFRRLAKQFDKSIAENIDCVVLGDYDKDARRWIELRHNGESEGVGIVEWDSVAKRRFAGYGPEIQALDWVKKYGGLTTEEIEALDNVAITTIQRVLRSRVIQQKIGYRIVRKQIVSDFPPSQLAKAFKKIVLDFSIRRRKVEVVYYAADQLVYAEEFGVADLPAASTAVARLGAIGVPENTANEVDQVNEGDFLAVESTGRRLNAEAPNADNQAARRTGSANQRVQEVSLPPVRTVLIPFSCNMLVTTPKLDEIYRELRTLNLDEYPNSAAVLLRVFVELSLDVYLRANNITMKKPNKKGEMVLDKTLSDKLADAISQVRSQEEAGRKYDNVARAVKDPESPLSTQSMHAYVHSAHYRPSASNLRLAWDNVQVLMAAIWAPDQVIR